MSVRLRSTVSQNTRPRPTRLRISSRHYRSTARATALHLHNRLGIKTLLSLRVGVFLGLSHRSSLVCSAMGVSGVTSSCLGVVVLGCFSTQRHSPATSDRGDLSTRESNYIVFFYSSSPANTRMQKCWFGPRQSEFLLTTRRAASVSSVGQTTTPAGVFHHHHPRWSL